MSKKNTPPCKDCKDREIGCHSRCEKYGKFRAENEKRYEQNRLNYHIKDANKERVR